MHGRSLQRSILRLHSKHKNVSAALFALCVIGFDISLPPFRGCHSLFCFQRLGHSRQLSSCRTCFSLKFLCSIFIMFIDIFCCFWLCNFVSAMEPCEARAGRSQSSAQGIPNCCLVHDISSRSSLCRPLVISVSARQSPSDSLEPRAFCSSVQAKLSAAEGILYAIFRCLL